MITRSSKRLKIAILADVPVWLIPGLEHLSRQGHYATWLECLIPTFAKHADLEIHWLSMSQQTKKPLTHSAYSQTFHVLPRWKKSFSMVTAYLFETRLIHKTIRVIEPDLVHAWGSEDVYGLAAARYGSATRLFTLQGCLSEYVTLLGGNFLFRLQATYEKLTIRRFRHGTAESPAAAEALRKIHNKMSIQQVDYGVHSDFFDANWNPSPQPIISFVGAVTRRKGIRDLITIAANPDFKNVRFQILGDGDLVNELQASSSSNVEWLGKCSRQQVIDALSSSWCLFIPTYADTGPTVIKEARVIGLPVITTSGAGASSYINYHQSGHVTEPGDITEMHKYLLSLCKSRDQCIQTGNNGHKETRSILSPEATASSFAVIYRLLCG